MKLFRAHSGWFLEDGGSAYSLSGHDSAGFTARDDLYEFLSGLRGKLQEAKLPSDLLAPVENQEIWASGVTYLRSRAARMEESKSSGGGDFYDRVYSAVRPELFFKSTAARAMGHGQAVRIRRDSNWNVPEPELTLAISSKGSITGYTIGNDMSSRDIEGENPLYLPQAKVYDGACAVGPGIMVTPEAPAKSTEIKIMIERKGAAVFFGSTTLAQMKRGLTQLAEYLYREITFPGGALLLTGTGIVPPDDFTLQSGDEVAITIEPIGTLRNRVA